MTDLERLEVAKAKDYLSLKDVVLITNLSESTIRSNIKEGKLKSLPSKPLQRKIFKKTDVIQWIENGYSGVFKPRVNNAETSN